MRLVQVIVQGILLVALWLLVLCLGAIKKSSPDFWWQLGLAAAALVAIVVVSALVGPHPERKRQSEQSPEIYP